jgi:rhodanese-related sulfurtransferase
MKNATIAWFIRGSLLVGLAGGAQTGCNPGPTPRAETRSIDSAEQAPAVRPPEPVVNNLSAEAFREALSKCPAEKRFLLDVRTEPEFAGGHLPGAVVIPVQELAARLDEIPRNKIIFLNCRSGRRSARAAKILVDAGFGPINHLKDGIMNWPYETVKSAPPADPRAGRPER